VALASRLRGVGPADVARVPSGDCRQRHWILARGVGADDRLHRREAAGNPVPARTADRCIPGVGSAVRVATEADGSLWFGTGLQLGLDWAMVFLYGLATQGTSAHNALFTGRDAGMRSSCHACADRPRRRPRTRPLLRGGSDRIAAGSAGVTSPSPGLPSPARSLLSGSSSRRCGEAPSNKELKLTKPASIGASQLEYSVSPTQGNPRWRPAVVRWPRCASAAVRVGRCQRVGQRRQAWRYVPRGVVGLSRPTGECFPTRRIPRARMVRS
jgi:hypothetical protein